MNIFFRYSSDLHCHAVLQACSSVLNPNDLSPTDIDPNIQHIPHFTPHFYLISDVLQSPWAINTLCFVPHQIH